MKNELIKRCITGTMLGLGLWYLFFYAQPIVFSALLLFILVLILFTEMPRIYNYKKPIAWIATLLYPIAPFLMLIGFNQHKHTRMLVLTIFVLSFANDVGAYFIGKLLGKHKLCPSLSPKKTIEGFIGGWIAILILFPFFFSTSMPYAVLGSFICAAVATLGDLFESWLKRRARVKDSGALLPGHGGLLDRFDSILAVTILIYLCKNLLAFR